ncbi:MAG: ribonuclease HII [Patescibacteria group bacterium]
MTYPNFKQESKFFQLDKKPIIALDEAGRGALAGPVVVAGVYFKKTAKKPLQPPIKIKDSKQLTPNQRKILSSWLKKQKNLEFRVSLCQAKTVDKLNIRRATLLAMKQTIKKFRKKKFIVFVDGKDKVPGIKQNQYAFVKGDEKIFSLACASIIAKVYRDKLMTRLAKKYPQYNFEVHKGYGTKKHFQKIKKHGPSPIHRKSFLRKNLKF